MRQQYSFFTRSWYTKPQTEMPLFPPLQVYVNRPMKLSYNDLKNNSVCIDMWAASWWTFNKFVGVMVKKPTLYDLAGVEDNPMTIRLRTRARDQGASIFVSASVCVIFSLLAVLVSSVFSLLLHLPLSHLVSTPSLLSLSSSSSVPFLSSSSSLFSSPLLFSSVLSPLSSSLSLSLSFHRVAGGGLPTQNRKTTSLFTKVQESFQRAAGRCLPSQPARQRPGELVDQGWLQGKISYVL